MHKRIGWIVLVVLVVVVIVTPGLFDDMFSLFFIGLIPNTNYVIDAPIMMAIDAFLLALAFYASIRLFVTASSPSKRDLVGRERARKKVLQTTSSKKTLSARPKKRYQPVVEH